MGVALIDLEAFQNESAPDGPVALYSSLLNSVGFAPVEEPRKLSNEECSNRRPAAWLLGRSRCMWIGRWRNLNKTWGWGNWRAPDRISHNCSKLRWTETNQELLARIRYNLTHSNA